MLTDSTGISIDTDTDTTNVVSMIYTYGLKCEYNSTVLAFYAGP